MLPLLTLTLEVLCLSIHYLKYLDYMLVEFEQNRMILNVQNLELFWQKMVNNLKESVNAILEDVLLHKQLFNAKVLTKRLSSFNVPKIMVVQYVTHSVLMKTYRNLNREGVL